MFFLSGTMKFLIIFALALVTVTANDLFFYSNEVPGFEKEGRITNGKDATPGDFKYQVGLEFQSSNGEAFCGGSLIDKNWVLTSAICSNGSSSVTVYLGARNFKYPEKVFTVPKSDIIIHSGFNPEKAQNDISLIRIPTTYNSSKIGIVKIPSNNNNKYVGDSVVVSGWGRTNMNSETLPVVLQYGLLKVSPASVCSEAYPGVFNDAMSICTATPNKVSPCFGDSGGPLVLEKQNLQIGVIQYGSSDGCAVGRPFTFTRVSTFIPWICQHTKINC